MFVPIAILLFLDFALAAPARLDRRDAMAPGIQWEADQPLPLLNLPYARYRANRYDRKNDIYVFKNIRFAAPPLGARRFAKPEPPLNESGQVQTGAVGNMCVQIVPQYTYDLSKNASGATAAVGKLFGSIFAGVAPVLFRGDEDCLFLDVYVPGSAAREPAGKRLPAVSWYYGGAFMYGTKEEFGMYDPTALIKASRNRFIWVASNYRLGAYGWLAGTTMERESSPNIGLYDQRAVLEWIQRYIHLVGGDKSDVTVIGESAGAASIIHHLTAYGGKQETLFKKAVLQSPGFVQMFDRHGLFEEIFHNFTREAGCPKDGGLACIRAAPKEALVKANEKVQSYAVPGSFSVGPAPDGKMVRQLASLEAMHGNVNRGVESLMLSHTSDEAAIFMVPDMTTDARFDRYVLDFYQNPIRKFGIVQNITRFYPPVNSTGSPYKTVIDRNKDFLRDLSFNCNLRFLAKAYSNKTWNLQYSQTPGVHASDLSALFLSPEAYGLAGLAGSLFKQPYLDVFAAYKSYLASYIVHGDPNRERAAGLPARVRTVHWPHPTLRDDQDHIEGVLEFGEGGVRVIRDGQIPRLNCEYLHMMDEKGIMLSGYTVPGEPAPRWDEVYGGRTVTAKVLKAEPIL